MNPIHSGQCPFLANMLSRSKPIDACLGVPGIPQSATGQTTLLTGVNAALVAGRHVEGFPNAELRSVIRRSSIYSKLNRAGLTSTFANGYWLRTVEQVEQMSLHSVTTVAALSGHGTVRCRDCIESDQAVYQDVTREHLHSRGYTGRLIPPAQAAAHLSAIARDYHLTVFEYFQTDRAGHACNFERAVAVLRDLDGFLSTLARHCTETGTNLMLTSDHGNIEDLATRRHTMNPVPLFAEGPHVGQFANEITSLQDIVPALLRLYGVSGDPGQ